MKRVFWSVLGLCTAVACNHQVDPSVTPRKIPRVSPPIQARAQLLITPSFEEYVSEGKAGFHEYRTQYGKAAARALSALVTESFVSTEIRHLKDVDALSLLTGPADSSVADLLLVPSFESAGAGARFIPADSTFTASVDVGDGMVVDIPPPEMMTMKADVKLRLNARSLRTGSTYTWVTSGGTGWVYRTWGDLTGSALEQALYALSDSLAAHRAELERVSPAR